MSMNDPLGDMLTRIRNASMRGKSTVRTPASKIRRWVLDVLRDTRIRNASMRGKSTVRTPASKIRRWVLDVLRDEGYIRTYEAVKSPDGHDELEISLKYFDGAPVIRELRRVSTPGRRVYTGVREMPQVIAIVSTPRGVMSDAQARSANVGGEVLCTVF